MIQKKVTDFFALEGNYPDLDGEGAAARLSAAIRCKTINYFDHSRTDYTEFDKLHAHIKASYPNIMRVGTFERIGHHAVLITIPGSDASLRPCLYMSHQDVVPVVEGTEQDWTHPAFSGDVADGYIWGRGTLDIKEQVFGVLEAAEYLLARGKSFARTAYLAFGDDEETINLGALAIAEHLKAQGVTSAAIRCKTINYFDHSRTDYTEFDKLHAHIKASYPNIMRVGTFERIGHHAVLITIPGSDASLRPCLYMSHQDVVPVVEGTEQDWTHPAFSGDVADGYIWGRGTLDIKEQVFGVLEAAEYLLARGKSFARTAYLAFGDDEETINLGALAIAEHLKAQGVTLEFVLDEGGCKIEPGTAFGAPETSIVSVQLMEKGYADLELSVHSIGGHSSRPYGGTSLGRLSGAIADITRAPFAVRLNSAMTGAFETLAPYITQEPLKTLVQDVAGNADAIAACCMGSPDLFPFVTTTIAPTMIRGGSAACNVMPQDMTAVINFRIADGDTVESVMAHCREAVQDKGVEMRFLQANDPSAIARRDGYGYRTVVESFQRYYPEAVFIPSMAVGATDAHRYEEICDTCLRCSPFMTEPAEAASGVHGTNERLLVRSYLQGIRVLIDLMEHANVEP